MTDKKFNSLALNPDYVLVLEYLAPSEHATGSKLVERWALLHPDVLPTMELKICRTGKQFLAEIKKAEELIPTRGIPIVHIESHGSEWENGVEKPMAYIGISPDENISWDEVWVALRSLNIASNFNLMVVAATCFGAEVERGIAQNFSDDDAAAVAFMATVGFEGKVNSNSLLEATTCFYEKLLNDNVPLEEAVSHARLLLKDDENLSLSWTVKTLRKVALNVLVTEREKSFESAWKRNLDQMPDSKMSNEEFRVNFSPFLLQAVQLKMGEFLAFETHPENKVRFQFVLSGLN